MRLIHITDTITDLKNEAELYKKARENILGSQLKEKAKIVTKEARVYGDLVYYLKFRSSLPEMDDALQDPIPKEGEIFGEREDFIKKLKDGHVIKELVEKRKTLRDEITELTHLTKRGDILYLQGKEVSLDSEVNRTAIVGLYREIDAIKSQIEALSKAIPTKAATVPEPVKKDEVTRPSKPVSKATSTQGAGLSKEVIRKQLESLRPIPSSQVK